MMTAVGRDVPERSDPALVLAEVFRSHWSALVGLARLLDRDDAEELVQEAFVRVYAGWDRLRDPADPLPYLRQVVVNLARSRGRHAAVVRRHAVHLALTTPAAEDTALAGEPRRAVLAALRALPRRQRECVTLRYLLECSTEETALAMGVSAGTVKTHLHRGLAALEVTLEDPR
jgi:RNA polymerase sigma-70 factor (sigma-E family)